MPDAEVVDFKVTDALPAQIHGFAVRCVIGPYPPHSMSHRRAVYAELTPVSDLAKRRMAAAHKQQIIGMVPITPMAARGVEADPDSRLAEMLARTALTKASALAAEVVA